MGHKPTYVRHPEGRGGRNVCWSPKIFVEPAAFEWCSVGLFDGEEKTRSVYVLR